MNQPNVPQDPGSESQTPLRRSLSDATERIEAVIEAAEKAAAGIIADAEAEAQRYLEESRARADKVAADRALAMTEVTDDLLEQAREVKRQSDDLIIALDRTRRQFDGGEPTPHPAVAAPRPEYSPVAEPAADPESESAETFSFPHLKPVDDPNVDPEPAFDPEPALEDEPALEEEPAYVGEPTIAEQPSAYEQPAAFEQPSAFGGPDANGETDIDVEAGSNGGGETDAEAEELSTGARLIATQMAVAGSSRPEIESRLRSEFGIDDAGPMLDAILGPQA
jgi:hypothetical protein